MKAVYSLFPKLLQDVPLEALPGLLTEAGADCVDLIVRDGYWVTPSGLERESSRFVGFMRERGIGVELATTSYTPEMLLRDPDPLRILSSLGVNALRIGYFPYKPSIELSRQLSEARSQMEKLAELCSTFGMKAIYQVHHGFSQLIQHSQSALDIVSGLPAEHVGIMLDPGNQFHEGREHYGRAFTLLGNYLAAVGVKDVAPRQDPAGRSLPGKGWSASWAPCQEGLMNWYDIGKSLRTLDQPVVVNVQPFYHPSNRSLHLASLRDELTYIREAFGKEPPHEQA